ERIAFRPDLVELFLLVLQVGGEGHQLAGALLGLPEVLDRVATQLFHGRCQGGVLGVLAAAQGRQVDLGVGVVCGGLGQLQGVFHGEGHLGRQRGLALALGQLSGEVGTAQVIASDDILGGVIVGGVVGPVPVLVVILLVLAARCALERALGGVVALVGLAPERVDRGLDALNRN